MTSRQEQPGFRIGSEWERQQVEKALRDYEGRKAEVRRVLEEVLATECRRTDGLLLEILSDGYREQTGKRPEARMVSDFLAELPGRLFPPKSKPGGSIRGNKSRAPRPVAVIGPGGEELEVTGGWSGAFRRIALAVVEDNPDRLDIWKSLPFVRPWHQLPKHLKGASTNAEVAPGLWLNTHGEVDNLCSKIRVMLDAFHSPTSRWRLRLDDDTLRVI